MEKMVFGCGYLGHRVATAWRQQGHRVHVATRSAPRAERLSAEGFVPHVLDITRPDTLAALPVVQSVLFAVGFDRAAGVPIEQVYVDGLRHVLAALGPGVARFIYISSTGVYGNAGGDWVDEQTPPAPARAGGRACWQAEQLLAAHPVGAGGVVLRLAGIYGPDRVPRAELLRQGEPVPAPAEGYLNLIHVDDAVRVVLAAEARAPAPRTYVVSDGRPPLRVDYYREAARLLGAPQPRFTAAEADTPQAARAAADKRASNARLRRELGVPLAFPTYRDGLAAALRPLATA